MKKLLKIAATLKVLFGAKKANTGESSWGDDASDFYKMIKAAFTGNFKFKKRNIIIVIAGIIYVLNPLDLLPAALLGPIGLVDDAAILIFLYKRITSELERFRRDAKFDDAEVIS
ncbi:MAG: hypothetical protein COA58_08000 [Bacteroidetes bacterium]|nr:MAG: hypothetical protein COA58_08000 [Bacteroidota bacterium]